MYMLEHSPKIIWQIVKSKSYCCNFFNYLVFLKRNKSFVQKDGVEDWVWKTAILAHLLTLIKMLPGCRKSKRSPEYNFHFFPTIQITACLGICGQFRFNLYWFVYILTCDLCLTPLRETRPEVSSLLKCQGGNISILPVSKLTFRHSSLFLWHFLLMMKNYLLHQQWAGLTIPLYITNSAINACQLIITVGCMYGVQILGESGTSKYMFVFAKDNKSLLSIFLTT